MYDFYPYLSKDGSVGLFSPSDDDIYHSTYGAATEAYEKFIFPANLDSYLISHDEINILDICYGIGYNSKSFLNYFLNFKKIFKKNFPVRAKKLSVYSEQIYADNNSIKNYNDMIYSNNISDENFRDKHGVIGAEKFFDDYKIYIKAIDTDKVLAFLSPFIISNGKKPPKNYKLPFKNDKISKFLSQENNSKNLDFSKKDKNLPNADISELIRYPAALNVVLLNKIIEKYPEIFEENDFNRILNDKNNNLYFNDYLRGLFQFYKSERGIFTPKRGLNGFLHNIYYKYLSKRHKRALNSPLYDNFYFDLKINDARAELKDDNKLYNFIFLDAFTPAKCPCLWTMDFFKLLFSHLHEDGMILTYSNSAAIRNAFFNAGFFVGKIYNPPANKFTGTVAVKNEALINYPLSEYDLGLVKSRAGIFYRDENLTAQNEAIISRHKLDVENSDLISSSKFIKQYKKLSEYSE